MSVRELGYGQLLHVHLDIPPIDLVRYGLSQGSLPRAVLAEKDGAGNSPQPEVPSQVGPLQKGDQALRLLLEGLAADDVPQHAPVAPPISAASPLWRNLSKQPESVVEGDDEGDGAEDVSDAPPVLGLLPRLRVGNHRRLCLDFSHRQGEAVLSCGL